MATLLNELERTDDRDGLHVTCKKAAALASATIIERIAN